MKNYLLLLATLLCQLTMAQQPNYTPKTYLSDGEPDILAKELSIENGQSTRFFSASVEILDVDDDRTTHVKTKANLLLCQVGDFSTSTKEGKYDTYAFLESGPRPFKIWEQSFVDDELDGTWKVFNVEGTLVSVSTYEQNKLVMSRNYQTDGKTTSNEITYAGNKVVEKEYGANGRLTQERPYENGKLNGTGFRYYPDGTVMEKVEFTDGEFNGIYAYYHPNGQAWVEITYKKGMPWEALGNYLASGAKRDGGTLKKGTGTLIYYHENGKVNEVHEYKDGRRVK